MCRQLEEGKAQAPPTSETATGAAPTGRPAAGCGTTRQNASPQRIEESLNLSVEGQKEYEATPEVAATTRTATTDTDALQGDGARDVPPSTPPRAAAIHPAHRAVVNALLNGSSTNSDEGTSATQAPPRDTGGIKRSRSGQNNQFFVPHTDDSQRMCSRCLVMVPWRPGRQWSEHKKQCAKTEAAPHRQPTRINGRKHDSGARRGDVQRDVPRPGQHAGQGWILLDQREHPRSLTAGSGHMLSRHGHRHHQRARTALIRAPSQTGSLADNPLSQATRPQNEKATGRITSRRPVRRARLPQGEAPTSGDELHRTQHGAVRVVTGT